MIRLWLLLFVFVVFQSFAGPPGEVALASKPVFTKASLISSCAPHDAISSVLALEVANQSFPRFEVNWWSQSRPLAKPGIYSIKGSGDSKVYSSSFCPIEKGCVSIKTLKIRVQMKTPTSGTVEFSIQTQKGENFNGTVPVEFKTTKPQYCG